MCKRERNNLFHVCVGILGLVFTHLITLEPCNEWYGIYLCCFVILVQLLFFSSRSREPDTENIF